MALLVGIYPPVTARKVLAGRAKVVKSVRTLFRHLWPRLSLGFDEESERETSTRNGPSVTDTARFEFGGQSQSLPDTQNTNVTAVVTESDTDVEVELSLRKGFEEGQWAFDLQDSGMVSAVVAEDRAD